MKLCPSENDLTRLLAEELSPEKTEATVTHVEKCAECQIRLEHLTESEYD